MDSKYGTAPCGGETAAADSHINWMGTIGPMPLKQSGVDEECL